MSKTVNLQIGDTVHSVRPEFKLTDQLETYLGVNTYSFFSENLKEKVDRDAPPPSLNAVNDARDALLAENPELDGDALEDAAVARASAKKPLTIAASKLVGIAAICGRPAFSDPPFTADDLKAKINEDGLRFTNDLINFVVYVFIALWAGNKRTVEEQAAAAEVGTKKTGKEKAADPTP